MKVQVVLAAAEKSDTRQAIPWLEQQGWQITTATTGVEALSAIARVRPFAAVVDVLLPEMNGWDVLESIRRDPILRSTAIILVYREGPSDEEYFQGCKLGADANIAAPVNPREVVAFLARVLMSYPEMTEPS